MSFRPPGPVLVLLAVVATLAFVPSSFSASDSGALATALDYLDENAGDYGVTSADFADLFVTSQYTDAHNGVTHVNLNQRYKGLEVFGGHVTVSIGRDGSVLFAGGSPVSLGSSAGSADLDAIDAVEAAADGLDLAAPTGLAVLSGAASAEAIISTGGISDAPIPARLGWQSTKDGLRLAWQLTIDDSSDVNLWNATVDAETGELLTSADWTSHDNLDDLNSLFNPPAPPAQERFPLPPSQAIDGSSYNIYQIPNESPNDGPRRIVENPADAAFSPFGWHDTDGVPGAEFTNLRGNNVHAYLDQDTSNSPDFGEPQGGAGLDFDFPVDFSQHSQAYREAVTTNLFYGCNIVHDVTAHYGFTEAQDNFQFINYSGVGSNGDYVRCEAADGSGTNNANFSTPSAGGTPRMQMYLWPGNQFGAQNQVSVDGGASYGAGWARFGPPAPNAGVTGAYFNSAANGCTAADYAGAPAPPWIAIAVGGTTGCQPIEKARQAALAGASAIVLTSGTADTTIIASNTGGMATESPAIPAVNISTANGTALRAALPASGTVRKNPSHPGIRDGDFDTGVIGHEYGHGVSLRMTGGPGINCLGGNEQMGEGWSDYLGLTITMDPTIDSPDNTRGLVPYVLFQPDRHGNGLRPRPYTRNMTVQPFTYDSIKTNGWLQSTTPPFGPTSLAVPHGIGHGWASILMDMNWDLVDKHGFWSNIYESWDKGGNTRALQYYMDGLKFQGCNPTFVIARNAIIAAANTLAGGVAGEQKGDACTIWGTFSRRGVGFSAIGGGTGRDDNTEAFDTHPLCRQGFSSGASLAYGQLNDADPGSTVQLKFSVGGNQGLDILQDHSPFSRKVDCTTLQVPSITPGIITPREYPIDAVGDLKYRKVGDTYTYNWQTDPSWLGTCREFVLAREGDGIQHRAFFKFVYPFAGFSGTFQSPPALNNTDSRNLQTFWWKMGGDRGLAIFSSDPATREIDCASKAPLGAYETATGTLAYQASTGRYSYAWQPPAGNAYKGTCREFTISLNDGTSHSVYLNFTR